MLSPYTDRSVRTELAIGWYKERDSLLVVEVLGLYGASSSDGNLVSGGGRATNIAGPRWRIGVTPDGERETMKVAQRGVFGAPPVRPEHGKST